MYLPEPFRETRPEVLAELIRRHGFATLVTTGPGGLSASRLPFLLDESRGPNGALLGHMARANPQWRDLERGAEALVLFHGPDAYVSPSWYETRPAVPTWNYAAVQVRGVPRLADEAGLRAIVAATAAAHEGPFPAPWDAAAHEELVTRLLPLIVGFVIPIARLEGKLKLSQNRPAADRAGVIAGLEREGGPGAASVAALMRRLASPEHEAETPEDTRIRPCRAEDEARVISLWDRCGLLVPWNDPARDVRSRLRLFPELFLVAASGDRILASVMAGWEGRRGWINYLAVAPEERGRGLGRRLMLAAEERLRALGCPKINLQVRAGNRDVVAFYERLGYVVEDLVSMGKKLPPAASASRPETG